jgi:outer membrane protein assembly factor BamB
MWMRRELIDDWIGAARWIGLGVLIGLGQGNRLEAADWPRLGGPAGTGVSPETGLSRAWPAEGPRVLWTVPLGEGFAGPAVVEGQVCLLDRVDDRQDVLRCLDLSTGRPVWTLSYDAPGKLPYNGSRNIPTIEGQFLFVVGPLGDFYGVQRLTHQTLWAKHLVKDFRDPQIDRDQPPASREDELARAQLPRWGLTQAPLVYRDTVIVAPQTRKIGLVAYEQATGRIRWESDYIGRNWYSHVSPYLARLCGIDQVIMLAQPSDPEKSPDKAPPALVSATDPVTGRILWTLSTPAPYKLPIPEPLQIASNRLFITGGYKLGCLILEVEPAADHWQAKVVFHQRTVGSHIQSPLLYQDRIYVTSFKEHGATGTGLVCLDRNAQLLWQTGPGLQFDFGSYLLADSLAYVLHGKTGVLHLIDLSAHPGALLAQARVLEAEDGMAWTPLALSQGKLLVRDQRRLKCLDVAR